MDLKHQIKYNYQVTKQRYVSLILTAIIIVLLYTSRPYWGYDFENYRALYDAREFPTTEYLYWLINYVFSYLKIPYEIFVLFISSIIIMAKSIWYFKFAPNPVLFFPIFLIVCLLQNDVGLQRMSLSIVFFIPAIIALYNNKINRTFCYLILSILCHHAAIFFVPFFIYKTRSILFFILFLLLMVAALQVFGISYFLMRFLLYLDLPTFVNKQVPYLVFKVWLLIIVFYIYKQHLPGAINSFFIYTASLMTIFFTNMQVYSRIYMYVSFFEVLALTYVLNTFFLDRDRIEKKIIGSILFIFAFLDMARLLYNFQVTIYE